MNTNSNKNSKLIASLPLIMLNKESKIKIGKINDPLFADRCMLAKDPSMKIYKLTEKKNKSDNKYTGTLLAEQASKYFILKFNEDTKKIEVFPGDDWWTFKKDINYNTMSLEEAEEKLKAKSGFTDYIRNKGNISKGARKEKLFKEERQTGTRIANFNDEDEDVLDEIRPFPVDKEQKSEEEREEDLDPELKDIPSDIEEVFLGKNKEKEKLANIAAGYEDFEEEEEESESSDDFFGKKDDESDDIDDDEDLSSIIDIDESLKEEDNNQPKTKQNDFLGTKRKGDDTNNVFVKVKKQKSAYDMEETLDYLFAKNKRMTYEKIVKELIRLDFKQEQIGINLPLILSRSCSKYAQGGENFYFKKSSGEN